MRRTTIDPILGESDLPMPVQAVIRSVCAEARVSRREKRGVARELVEHFHAGLERDESVESLIDEFGDPIVAGKLIARAVRRKRSPLRRVMTCSKRAVYATAALFLVVYLGLFARYMLGEPNPSRDYLGELAERVEAIPESDRAWPLYLEASRRSTDMPMSLFDREPVEAIGRDYVASHPEVLELIRKAAERRYVAYPISTSPNTELERINAERRGTEIESASGAESDEEDVYDDALIGILLGNIGEMRVFAHLLEVDARVALEEHDTQRFVRNIEAMIGIAEQFGREKFVISYLVGRVIAEDASEIVRRALAASPNAFDEAQLRRMQRAMETTEGARSPVDMSVERLFFEDIVQRIYTDDGSGNGRVTRAGMRTYKDLADIDGGEGLLADPTLQFLAAPASLVVTADRAELMEKYDEIMLKIEAHMRTPLWEEPIEHPDMVVERIHEEQRYKYPLITTFLPALSRLRMRGAIADQHLDSAVLALALERYRLGHGSYPERLDARELGVPATSMIDQMTGNTLRYIVTPDGQGYTLYSFGNDLDDDGGVSVQGGGSSIHTRYSPEILAQMDKERLAELDGDWVLFPLPAAVPSAAE